MQLKIICLVCLCYYLRVVASQNDLLTDILSAIELALSFYSNNYMRLNLDGIFGLRILEGQMMHILDKLMTHPNLPVSNGLGIPRDDLIAQISTIQRRSKNISDTALIHIHDYNPEYYSLMSHIVEQPWIIAKSHRHIKTSLQWSKEQQKLSGKRSSVGFEIQEEFSDACMNELMGGGEGDKKSQAPPCLRVSMNCISVMSEPGHREYDLTHQLLYTMVAEQHNCTRKVNDFLILSNRGVDMDRLQAEFCANNFYEVSQSVLMQRGNVLPRMQDLFLEQEFVCPVIGYAEFLHADWLSWIIQWQRENGCWGQMYRSKASKIVPDDDYEYMPEDVQSALAQPSLKWNVQFKASEVLPIRSEDLRSNRPSLADRSSNIFNGARKLLYERKLEDGCLSHKTAVAVGALSQYLRFLLVASPLNVTPTEYLHDVNFLLEPHKLGMNVIFHDGDHVAKPALVTSKDNVVNENAESSKNKKLASHVSAEKDYTEKFLNSKILIEKVTVRSGVLIVVNDKTEKPDQSVNNNGIEDNSHRNENHDNAAENIGADDHANEEDEDVDDENRVEEADNVEEEGDDEEGEEKVDQEERNENNDDDTDKGDTIDNAKYEEEPMEDGKELAYIDPKDNNIPTMLLSGIVKTSQNLINSFDDGDSIAAGRQRDVPTENQRGDKLRPLAHVVRTAVNIVRPEIGVITDGFVGDVFTPVTGSYILVMLMTVAAILFMYRYMYKRRSAVWRHRKL